MPLLKIFWPGKMEIRIYKTRKEAGKDAAAHGAFVLRKLLADPERSDDRVNVIFAAAPSQNDTLAALRKEEGIDWSRVRAFHMDEYVGFGRERKESFGYYLYKHVFGKLPFGEVHYLRGDAPDPEAECARYAGLLEQYPPDIVFLGIGENAHIAFNDPWVADFHDPKPVKLVQLDQTCRMQQVHDGCFPTLDDVPTHAFTLTVPTLMRAGQLICTVPGATKADAVWKTYVSPAGEAVPSTAMRSHPHASMYCDAESGKRLLCPTGIEI